MRRVGGKRIYAWPLAQSGETVDRQYTLLPGTYRLTCGVANHSQLGMVATLHVR
jgi:plastocyanin